MSRNQSLSQSAGTSRERPPLPPPFRCSWEWEGVRAARAQVSGELDLATAPRLAETLADALSDARLVVLDLRDLAFTDVIGVRTIVDASRAARQNGRRLAVTRGPRPIRSVFALTGAIEELHFLDVV